MLKFAMIPQFKSKHGSTLKYDNNAKSFEESLHWVNTPV